MRKLTQLLTLCLAVVITPVAAQTTSAPKLFAEGAAALEQQRIKDAITRFESLADRGFRNADASYNRGRAYLARASSTKAKPGDWGQAAAGFAEALSLNRQDGEARRALAAVQQKIARSRVRAGKDPVIVQAPLGRALADAAPEGTWALLALVCSAIVSLGIALRRRRSAPIRLTGSIGLAGGGVLLVIFAALTLLSRHYRLTSVEGVVIISDARLLDETGRTLTARALDSDATAIPEGASVFLGEQSGRLRKVQWGSLHAWVDAASLRVLQR